MFNYITKSIIPIIVFIIITYGMIKGRKVYEWFVEGAKEGLKVCANIFPYLLAMAFKSEINKRSSFLRSLKMPLMNSIFSSNVSFSLTKTLMSVLDNL